MRTLFLKGWNSPTVTTWASQAVTPLRLLILTPLVLNRFSKTELDVFYLIASANLLFAVFQARLGDTFIKMLAYAHGGADDLSAWKPGMARAMTGAEPNWPLFGRCYSTLAVLQYLATIPALAFALVTGWWAVGKLTNWEPGNVDLWIAMFVGVAASALDIITARYRNALMAVNQVAFCNRLQTFASVATILTNCGALLLGAGLIAIVTIPVVFVLGLRMFLIKSLPKALSGHRGFTLDRKVIDWAWPPLWRGFIGQISTLGAQRSAGLFLAATQMPGLTAQYLLCRNLLNSLQNVANPPLISQFPRYARMLGRDERAEMVRDALSRVGISNVVMAAGVLAAAMVVPYLLDLIDANIGFLSITQWLVFGGVFTLMQTLNNFGSIFNLTNQQAFYRHNAVAAVISVGCYYLGAKSQNLWWFILGSTLPYVIVLNIYPLQRLRELSNLTYREMLVCLFALWRRGFLMMRNKRYN